MIPVQIATIISQIPVTINAKVRNGKLPFISRLTFIGIEFRELSSALSVRFSFALSLFCF